MEVIKSNNAVPHKNSDDCTAYEYEFHGEEDINGAVIKLTGRYPESGQVVNDVCKELVYIIEGSGLLYQADKKYELGKGDVVLIQPGESYYYEGTFKMFVSGSPAWYPQQHHNIQ